LNRPRLEAIRLEYGCHSGRFDLPEHGRPVVIAGRNGSGKTTLLEAFLRGLYGFNRRKAEEKRLLEFRRPWSGRPAEVEVWLTASDGTAIVVRRDLTTDEVVARNEESGEELFRGDGNPVGIRSESRRYQELLREWIGFGTLEPYRGTAWIAQGELVDTKLDDELLRAAAGTHRRVEVALTELRAAFEDLTREPLELGGRRKNRSRELEDLREALETATRRLEVARGARERKRPHLERAGEMRLGIESVEAEIDLLEAAYRPITERRTLIAEQKEAEARLTALSEAARSLDQATAGLTRAEAEEAAAVAEGVYPADFESRLGQAEVLWDRRERLATHAVPAARTGRVDARSVRTVVTVVGAGAIVVGAGIALVSSAVLGAAVALGGVLTLATREQLTRIAGTIRGPDQSRLRDEELETIRARLESIAAGVPAPPLAPATVSEHRRSQQRQADSRVAALRAAERHAEATDRAESLLDRAASGGPRTPDTIESLETEREEARTTLARVQLRLEEQPATPALPEGVDPTVPAVESARDDRRRRRDALREQLTRLDLELRDLDRASEDVFALEREVSALRDRVGEAESEVSVRRFAWELVSDAYEEFRSTDQARLVSSINLRLGEVSGGRLGPIETPGDLATAQVGLDGRMVALDSPPLSFGEKHAALLAIRLGTADFLSREGTLHPLLVDEPFTHLDEVRSREAWEVLQRLAVDRQVIVTTQDRLVLDHLGIEPHFDLAVPARPVESESPRPVAPSDQEAHSAEKTGPSDAPSQSTAVQVQLELG
jgi:DNA repair exonuclease SbcCD ATPase subunit